MQGNILSQLEPFAPLSQPADRQPYENGARHGSGRCVAVVRPSSEIELRELVKRCLKLGVRLVVQGANTSLVGAAIPDRTSETVVLSTERMRWICDLSPDDLTVRVGAGTRLSQLNEYLEPFGLWLPIDLGADPSIGGMVSTNTGGSRLMRYGDMRSRTCALRLMTLTTDPQVLQLGRGLQKDNAGLDLKQVIIGSCGSLGIVTEATVRLARRPCQTTTALLALGSADDAAKAYRNIGKRCEGLVSAFEGISSNALELSLAHVSYLQRPFATKHAYYVLVELCTGQRKEDLALDDLLVSALEELLNGLVQDAVLGTPERLWSIRHSLTEGARSAGQVIAFDVSVRRDLLPVLLAKAKEIATRRLPAAMVADFGHWGDGGMHFNLVVPRGNEASQDQIRGLRKELYDVLTELGGSFSAEHGIGPANLDIYQDHTTTAEQAFAGAVQRVFNPTMRLGRVSFDRSGVHAGA